MADDLPEMASKGEVVLWRPPHRPTIFTQVMADEICERMVDGESLRAICRDGHMPNASTVGRWLANPAHVAFCTQYARARELQADMLADESLEIADDARNDYMEKLSKDGLIIGYDSNPESVARSRLRIDARKWFAGKIAPKKYGDAATIKLANHEGEALPSEDRIERLALKIAGLIEPGREDNCSLETDGAGT